ncbi:hypothetical protein HY407_00220 [Candidatus Gottesmanbacteria bacterium]|nr:hypothetical protein [Candidatus Gottesmanbacteria bacterium]
MNTNIVTTNVRIPKNQYMQAKNNAADLDMSLNEYINTLIEEDTKNTFFGHKGKKVTGAKKEDSPYQALLDLAKKPYKPEPMGASEDDKIIYGIKD